MTQKEKLKTVKSTVQYLYETEGRSKSYIAKILDVNRKNVAFMIKEWGFEQKKVYRMTPSNQKFINKHQQFIKSRFDKDIPLSEIAIELGCSKYYLAYVVKNTPSLKKSKDDYVNRMHKKAALRREESIAKSHLTYVFTDLPGEIWRPILGYEHYFVSNMGRIKSYKPTYDTYVLLQPHENPLTHRLYAYLGKDNLEKPKSYQLARLVGFAFVEGHSDINNTIDHIDGNFFNNKAENLRWVSQKENNANAYKLGRAPAIHYSKNGRFKKIIANGKYEFKTIEACARFFDISPTQLQRYISGECKQTKRKIEIEFIY